MGSKTFEGVWFTSFSDDHTPAHVHGQYGEVVVIVELLSGAVRRAVRRGAVQPTGAKRSHVRHILKVADRHRHDLMKLWEKAHGTVE